MKKKEQERWNKAVLNHWWARGRYKIVKTLIKHYTKGYNKKNNKLNILDIGCSGGHVMDFLKQFGKVYGFDISFYGLKQSQSKNKNITQADAMYIPFRNDTFDIVTLLEVAEHIKNDKILIKEVNRICKKGALVFISVPAYKLLWGSHDIKYLHKRRYSRKMLISLAQTNNFMIKKITYLHPHILLPLFIRRFLDKLSAKGAHDDFLSFGNLLDSLLYRTLLLESRLLIKFSFPLGTSLFCVLKKPGC